jgi:hypothetical protein
MRPRHQIARERLEAVLTRRGPLGAAELADILRVSGPTVLRMLKEQAEHVVEFGQARRRRYAWRRPLRGELAPLPLYAVGRDGQLSERGTLSLIQPAEQTCWQGCGQGAPTKGDWPIPAESADGRWDGLPYPLQDMRPQGYMGRQFAHAHHQQLGLSDNPAQWSDGDALVAMSQLGGDLVGDLIVGHASLAQWQARRSTGLMPIAMTALSQRYAELAQEAVAAGVPGSSAAGEFPKFTAVRSRPGAATPHVIVKFSGADDSAAVRRWSDLLVCEHLALQAMRALPGVAVASTCIVQHAGRTFLESERFDRHGDWGRSPLVGLGTLDGAFVGSGSSDWTVVASRLRGLKLLHEDEARCVALMWWFGRLIANADMHAGNLSFVPCAGALTLAPAYDMLPMMYAPLAGGEVPERHYRPSWPQPAQRETWQAACDAALAFWQAAASDERISPSFRQLCAGNVRKLAEDRLLV